MYSIFEKKLTREDYELKNKIMERAERMGLFVDQKLSHMIDLNVAVHQFDMRLQEWLDADDENFCHDWFGIYAHINRETCRVEDLFMPRFANPTKGE